MRNQLRQLRERRQDIIQLQKAYWETFDTNRDQVGEYYMHLVDQLSTTNNMLRFYKSHMPTVQYMYTIRDRMQRIDDGLIFTNTVNPPTDDEEQ